MLYIIDYIRDLYLKITHAATWEEGCTAFKNFYEGYNSKRKWFIAGSQRML